MKASPRTVPKICGKLALYAVTHLLRIGTHIRRALFARMPSKEIIQSALAHPVTDEAQRRLVRDAQEGNDIGMSQMPPDNHFISPLSVISAPGEVPLFEERTCCTACASEGSSVGIRLTLTATILPS
jgi:hypothetical protein